MRRILSGLVLVAVLVGTVGTGGAASAPDSTRSAYIVVLRNEAGDPGQVAADHARRESTTVTHVYRHALRGYSARMSATAATRLASDSRVAYVEADGPVSIVESPQSNPTWGLDRIDDRELPLDNSYTYGLTGSGVTAYIIDTGIMFGHTDFGGRAVTGFDAVDGGSADDCSGHGTHVAGSVGGSAYGVAKGVTLVGVRVLDCSGNGTSSGVIAGIDWATAHHTAGPAVANMSLGGGASSALDTAVKNSIADGITYGVAAGNGNRAGVAQDACGSSPARVPAALTVGATSSTDAKASWSNYGTCLDLFAPGVSITSAWYTSSTAINTISGTSMATPHVVGVAALYLQGTPAASPAAVAGAITTNATSNKVTGAGTGSPNRLLYSMFGEGISPPPPPPTYALTLAVTKGAKVKGQTTVTLDWVTSDTVDVTRNDSPIAQAVAGSAYQDTVRGGTYTYQVCRPSSPTECSNPATISI